MSVYTDYLDILIATEAPCAIFCLDGRSYGGRMVGYFLNTVTGSIDVFGIEVSTAEEPMYITYHGIVSFQVVEPPSFRAIGGITLADFVGAAAGTVT